MIFALCLFFVGALLPHGFPPTLQVMHTRECGDFKFAYILLQKGFLSTGCLGKAGTKSVSSSESVKYLKLQCTQVLTIK